jgi:hypothetical protein
MSFMQSAPTRRSMERCGHDSSLKQALYDLDAERPRTSRTTSKAPLKDILFIFPRSGYSPNCREVFSPPPLSPRRETSFFFFIFEITNRLFLKIFRMTKAAAALREAIDSAEE